MSMIIVDFISKISFQLRWLMMSDREKYAYLWNRTRDSLRAPYYRW